MIIIRTFNVISEVNCVVLKRNQRLRYIENLALYPILKTTTKLVLSKSRFLLETKICEYSKPSIIRYPWSSANYGGYMRVAVNQGSLEAGVIAKCPARFVADAQSWMIIEGLLYRGLLRVFGTMRLKKFFEK